MRVKILCLGDSLTFGFGVPRRFSWTTVAQKELGVVLINAGVPGDTTGGMLARLPGELEKHRPAVISLMGGANDIFFGGDDGPARANMAALCHQSTSRNVRPILCAPTPVQIERAREDWAGVVDFFAAQEMAREYVEWLRRFARTFQLPFLDFWTEFTGRLAAGEDLYVDGLHPNAQGQAIMAEMFVAKVRELSYFK